MFSSENFILFLCKSLKKNPLYYHPCHVFARNAVAICRAAGKGDRIVGHKTISTGASEKGILQQGIVDGFLYSFFILLINFRCGLKTKLIEKA